MKKFMTIAAIAAIVCLAAGNFYYTYKARKETRCVMHMAYAMERSGIIDAGAKASVLRFVRQQHSILRPDRSYKRLKRMHENLLRIRSSWHPQSNDGTFHAFSVPATRMYGLKK